MTNLELASYESVKKAVERIKGKVHRTPVLTSTTINRMVGESINLFFKCENFQKVGAFKIRGATNFFAQLIENHGIEELRVRGVVAHSSGNHAQAVALVALQNQIPAHIVVPKDTPKVKKAAVFGYKANLYECEPTNESRLAITEKIIKKNNSFFIPSFDHPHTISGQGTATLELLEECEKNGSPLDAVILQISGGGLLSGGCLATKGFNQTNNRNVLVFGSEPTEADDAYQSFHSGNRIALTQHNTIADGLRANIGELTFPIIKENCEDILLVTEEQIIVATRLIWERMKIVVEPSGAVPLAAVLFNSTFKEKYPHVKNIGLMVSGGNIELSDFFASLTL